MKPLATNLSRETRFAKSLYEDLPKAALCALTDLIQQHKISVGGGDVRYNNGGWYVTHSLRRLSGLRCGQVEHASFGWVLEWRVFVLLWDG